MSSAGSPDVTRGGWRSDANSSPGTRAWQERLIESGLVPDVLIRGAIRALLRQRLRQEDRGEERNRSRLLEFVEEMKRSRIALCTEAANAQHYEVPARFFEHVLGPRMKYSSAYFPEGSASLAEAETTMLALTSERAGLADGQRVLELGCGWGSLTLWMAEHFPASRISAVSNSASQRAFIESRAAERGLKNLRLLTADMNAFDTQERFDRIVSVEMFEHMRNWGALLRKAATWLQLDGQLFIHIFSHTRFAYPFEVHGASDWMAQHFFTGGMMPSHDLLSHFDEDLRIRQEWQVSGTHYQKTAEAWLKNMDANRSRLLPLIAETYGERDARIWWMRWRIFFMACAELWGFRGGTEWMVSHYLLERV